MAVDAKYRIADRDRGIGQKKIDVIFPWPFKVAIGAQVCRDQTLITLSQLATANMVFSWFTARSDTSVDVPRKVASNRPSMALQIFTK